MKDDVNSTKPEFCEHCGGRRPLEGADAEALLDSLAQSATPEEMKERERRAKEVLAFVMTPAAERKRISLKPPTRQQIIQTIQEMERECPPVSMDSADYWYVRALRWVLTGDPSFARGGL